MPRTRTVQFSPLICSTAVLTFFVICKNYTISSSNERLESHLPKRSPQSWRTMPSSTIFFLPFFRHIAAISDIYQIEEAFVNFIKGVSGGDPGMTRRQYSRRIDKFVRDIKTSFRTLGHSIVKLECKQMQYISQNIKSQIYCTVPKTKKGRFYWGFRAIPGIVEELSTILLFWMRP